MSKRILLSQNGQALVRCEEQNTDNTKVRYEWWKDIGKMDANIYTEEIDGLTKIYCVSFNNSNEEWLLTQFKQRVSLV